MDPMKVQIQDALARLTNLEQRERKNSEEILSLTKQNSDLIRKTEKSERKVQELRLKLEAFEKRFQDLKGLKPSVAALKGEANKRKNIQEELIEVDRIRKVLNRSLVQSHDKELLKEGDVLASEKTNGHKTDNLNGEEKECGSDSPVLNQSLVQSHDKELLEEEETPANCERNGDKNECESDSQVLNQSLVQSHDKELLEEEEIPVSEDTNGLKADMLSREENGCKSESLVLNRSLVQSHDKELRKEGEIPASFETNGHKTNILNGEENACESYSPNGDDNSYEYETLSGQETNSVEEDMYGFELDISEESLDSETEKEHVQNTLMEIFSKAKHVSDIPQLKRFVTDLNEKVLNKWEKAARCEKSLSEQIQALKERNDKSDESLFCAQLKAQHPLSGGSKMDGVVEMMADENSPLQSGSLLPQDDGAYHLGWRMMQRGEGKISYCMHVQGLEGNIFLGCTREMGDVCTGAFIIPLRRSQKVWLVANRVVGDTARIASCNFFGRFLKPLTMNRSFDDLTKIQSKLFQTTKLVCQHL